MTAKVKIARKLRARERRRQARRWKTEYCPVVISAAVMASVEGKTFCEVILDVYGRAP